MAVSLTTTPMMAALLLRPPAGAKQPGRARQALARTAAALSHGYRRSLRWTLRHQPLALAVLAAVIAINVALWMSIPKGFFPQQDTGLMVGSVQADQSSSFQAMQSSCALQQSCAPTRRAMPPITGGGQRNTANMFSGPRAERAAWSGARMRHRLAIWPGQPLSARCRLASAAPGEPRAVHAAGDELADLTNWSRGAGAGDATQITRQQRQRTTGCRLADPRQRGDRAIGAHGEAVDKR